MNGLIRHKYFLLILLTLLSAILYGLDYALLGSFRELSVWFLGNLAFLPLYVIFVTLMVEQIMKERERQTLMRKLNMVIGVFFSEVGNHLLKELSGYVDTCADLRREMGITSQWRDGEFQRALTYLQQHDYGISCSASDRENLKVFLLSRRSFLVGLLENQSLLEHEQFTDLLWAVFHLVEELAARESLDSMPKTDIDHINGDIKRVYGHLSREWVLYMKHLKHDYPYLFSLAVRLNPMLERQDPLVY